MREDVREGDLWEDALNQVDMNWFGGPFPFDEGGKRVTGWSPLLANLAFRFGFRQREELRAVGDLTRSQTT